MVISYSLQRGQYAPRSLCVHAQLCLFVSLLQTVARQAPLSTDFFEQEDWSGLPFPTPEDLSDPGIKSESLASPALACGFFTKAPSEKLSISKVQS